MAVQVCLPPKLLPISMGLVQFLQTFGGALFLACAQTLFNKSLTSGLAKYAPNVDGAAVIAAGATGFRSIVNKADLPGVLEAYDKAVNYNFYLVAGAAVALFFASFGMGWRKIEKAKSPVEAVAVPDGEAKV